MGKQYLNGVLYGSPTVVADEIIDYTTSLYNGSTSFWATTISYTATSKCIAYLRYTGNNGTRMYPILNGGNALSNLGILKPDGYYMCSVILQPGDTLASRYQADEDRYGTPYFHMKIYAIKANTSENYSTTERIIGTYLGKPLYQKTLTNITFPSGQSSYAHNLNIDDYVSVEGWCKVNNGTNKMAFPFYQHRWNAYCEIISYSTNMITIDSTWNNNTAELTIRYTKTTD